MIKKGKTPQRNRAAAPPGDIDAYLKKVPKAYRQALEDLRLLIKATLPDGVEAISYRIPTIKYQGHPLVAFAAFTDHCSFFVLSSTVLQSYEDELKAYKTSAGTIHFTPEHPLTAALVKMLIQARMAENEAGTGRYGTRPK